MVLLILHACCSPVEDLHHLGVNVLRLSGKVSSDPASGIPVTEQQRLNNQKGAQQPWPSILLVLLKDMEWLAQQAGSSVHL
jgi:hypothetical protein